MSRRDPAPAPSLDPSEVARLEALRRLAMGAAHTLNNAFTTLVGEASFLQDDRKHDPLVVEACETMRTELERCTRITRALLARRHPSQGREEADLVRLVHELGGLLQETLGRQHELTVETPDDLVPVAGDARDLELLVLALVHYAADGVRGTTALRLAVEDDRAAGLAHVRLEVRAAELPEDAVDAFLAPEHAADPVVRATLGAVADLVGALGGQRHAARMAPDAWAARLSLPLLA